MVFPVLFAGRIQINTLSTALLLFLLQFVRSGKTSASSDTRLRKETTVLCKFTIKVEPSVPAGSRPHILKNLWVLQRSKLTTSPTKTHFPPSVCCSFLSISRRSARQHSGSCWNYFLETLKSFPRSKLFCLQRQAPKYHLLKTSTGTVDNRLSPHAGRGTN